MHPSIGLVGRILAIVLLAILIEFCASTLLYDRTSRLWMREDDTHRVAEHVATAGRILSQRRPAERPATAERLSSKNFTVHWRTELPPAPPMPAELSGMRDQITTWEPMLADHGLHLQLKETGHGDVVTGRLQLEDGSWLIFKAPQLLSEGKFRLAWIAMMLIVAVCISLIAALMVRLTLKPIRRLAEAAGRIGHGAQETIPEMGGGEVRRLVRAFNEMQGRIHSLISDRVEALAAVGHDLRTPLARMQLRIEAIPDRDLRGAIGKDVKEMSDMVSSLLAYLGGDEDPERPQSLDIAVMAATLVDEVSDLGGNAQYEGPSHLEHVVRPVGFKRAVRNIVENAAKYGDSLTIRLEDAPDGASLSIDDDGPGIAEERLEEVLRPFVRLDTARGRDTNGLGLGLAIAAAAIEREGGRLDLANRPQGGLSARIFLPKRPTAAAA